MDLNSRYIDRANHAENPAAKKLFELMEDKKTNLALFDDVTDSETFLKLADTVGPEIAILKTHIDIIEDFSPDIIKQIQELSKKHNFMIFEDRKFADIGNTVQMQYAKGIYKIADWADFVNLHIVPGPGIIKGLKEIMQQKNDGRARGLLILAQMSTEGTLCRGDYTKKAVEMANENKDAVAGFIGAGSNAEMLRELSSISDNGQIIFTPGVKLAVGSDALGQKYATPESAVLAGADIIGSGRGIYGAENPAEEAKKFREAGWNAYLKRVGD